MVEQKCWFADLPEKKEASGNTSSPSTSISSYTSSIPSKLADRALFGRAVAVRDRGLDWITDISRNPGALWLALLANDEKVADRSASPDTRASLLPPLAMADAGRVTTRT
jgi:hypothetical protein